MKIGVIIPVFKNPDQVKKCLKAIDDLETKCEVEVFQHDNNQKNIGFTRAINLGLKYFEGCADYCVVLNQDCYLKPDFIKVMVDFMGEHPKCFIAGAKQLLCSDEDIIIHGGCTVAYPAGRHIVGKVSKGDCSKNARMPWVNGACMFVNMGLLTDVGMMDKNFYLIGSDSDWCYTARLREFEVWYVADAIVTHEQGVSMKKSDQPVEYKKLLDMVYFRDKWITDGAMRELHMEIFN